MDEDHEAGSEPAAVRISELERKVDNLHRALASREVIAQAVGMLMVQSRLRSDAAFEVLRQASQRLNRPVRELAAEMVATFERRLPAPDGRDGEADDGRAEGRARTVAGAVPSAGAD